MIEIERKFLVDIKKWQPSGDGKVIRQGYLSVDPERVIRVRISNDKAFLTIKGKSRGISRTELEYPIPPDDAAILMNMCTGHIVEKIRYCEYTGTDLWEVDVFTGENQGLVMAEIELADEEQDFNRPEWITREVSDDKRFYNALLSQYPFSGWKESLKGIIHP